MLLGLFSGLHDGISVQDIGLDNQTAADGLAVGRPSGLAGPLMEPILSGCYTADDGTLFSLLYQLRAAENKSLEPLHSPDWPGPSRSFRPKPETVI